VKFYRAFWWTIPLLMAYVMIEGMRFQDRTGSSPGLRVRPPGVDTQRVLQLKKVHTEIHPGK
jgi:hypothetical protein